MQDEREWGWCHQCQTFQLLEDAPRLETPYDGPGPVPCCVVCREEEPWSLGVFDQENVEESEPGLTCGRKHAIRQDSHYPGDCECERGGEAPADARASRTHG